MDVHYAVIVILLLIIVVLLVSFVSSFCVFCICRLQNNNKTTSKQSALPTRSELQLPTMSVSRVSVVQDVENEYCEVADFDLDKSEEYIDDNYSAQGEFLSSIEEEDTYIDDTLSMQAESFVYSENDNSDTEISSDDKQETLVMADVHHYYILEHDV